MKKVLAIILCLATMLAVCGCAFGMPSLGKKSGYVKYESNYMNGMIDEDGKSHFATFSAEDISIKGDARSARMSYDRQKIAILDNDGKLTVYTDPKDLGTKDTIAKNGDVMRFLGDYGIFYQDADKNIFRYLFSEGKSVEIGNYDDIDAYYIDMYFNIVYAKDGGIYFYKNDSATAEKIGKYDSEKDIDILSISKDCNIFSWSVEEGQTCELYISENGNTEKIGTMELSSKYGYAYAITNQVSKCTIFYSYYSDVMYIKPVGKDVMKVKLGKEYSSGIYTQTCIFKWDPSETFTGIYILTEADKDKTLYYIDAEGDRDKLLTGVKDYHVFEGYLYYTDSDSTLYYAKVDGSELGEPTKLSSNVSSFTYALNTGYVYYLKNYEDNEGTLYMYKQGDEEPVKVSSGVFAYSATSNLSNSINNSMDGKTVFYYKDVEQDVGKTYEDVGTLYSFTYGDEKSVKISGDVLVGSASSGIYPSELDPSSLIFKKYQSDGVKWQDKDAILVNWVFYNGSETATFAKNLLEN